MAIIGGGCASLAAAFELSRPEHQGRYEITVYQLGWRLGGKGASGRGPSQRIEEHGLHLWMGFYENAFALMRACYAERRQLHPEARFAGWRDAFKPAPDVAVADRLGQDWSAWRAHFAPGRGEPGDPLSQGSPFTVLAYLRQSALLVAELLRSAGAREAAGSPAGTPAVDPGRSSPQAIGAAVEARLRYGQFASLAAAAEAGKLLLQAINSWVPQMLRPPRQPHRLPPHTVIRAPGTSNSARWCAAVRSTSWTAISARCGRGRCAPKAAFAGICWCRPTPRARLMRRRPTRFASTASTGRPMSMPATTMCCHCPAARPGGCRRWTGPSTT